MAEIQTVGASTFAIAQGGGQVFTGQGRVTGIGFSDAGTGYTLNLYDAIGGTGTYFFHWVTSEYSGLASKFYVVDIPFVNGIYAGVSGTPPVSVVICYNDRRTVVI